VPDAAAPARALRKAEERTMLWRLFIAVFAMMQVMMYQAPLYLADPGAMSADLRKLLLWAAWLLSIPVVLFSAAPMFREAWEGLRRRRVGMDLPVSIGIALTFIVSTGATFAPGPIFGSDPLFDSLTMFVSFLLAGRWLALKTRNRVAASLEGALSRLPAAVRVVADDGATTLIPLHRLQCGDRVRVLAGEAFPADGRLLEGDTEVDEALLTGESRPVPRNCGDDAPSASARTPATKESSA
jgi:Cu2+-exporting ATPase